MCLRRILGENLPSLKTIKARVLPTIRDRLNTIINDKLINCSCLSIVVDIWSSKAMVDFLALSVVTCHNNFSKENLVVGMVKMFLPHNAENSNRKHCFRQEQNSECRLRSRVLILLRLFKQFDNNNFL